MGPGGVAARAGQPDHDLVAGTGDRPAPQADRAHLEAWVAVQREESLHIVDGAIPHRRQGALDDLLSGLEQQPHPSGQQPPGGPLGQE